MSRAALKSIQAAASSGGAADTGDEYFGNTVLLLDGDGTDGGANSLFSDSSSSNFTMSETGTVTQGSFSPYLNNWSNYFGNADSNVTFTPSFTMGTNDFCIEFWANFTETPASSIVGFFTLSVNTGDYLRFELNNAGQGLSFRIRKNNANDVLLSQYTDGSNYDTPKVWTHFAVTRSSNTFRFFVDGVLRESNTFSGSLSAFTLGSIGCWTQIANDFKGYISNLRITNGSIPSSRQTSSTTSGDEIFTPPTSNLSAITDTVLLTCQSNHFVDNSSSPHTLSVNATPQITPFSPAKDSDAIDITTKGGSAFFDNDGTGNNNYLQSSTAGFALNAGNYTMEAWVYPTSGTSSYAAFFSTQGGTTNYAPNLAFGDSTSGAGYFKHYINDTSAVITSSTTFPLYSWYHVAVVWDDTNKTLYVNGKSVGTHSGSYSSTVARYRIGGWDTTSGADFPGYVAGARLIRGVVYKDEFDPPTSPISNTVGAAWSIQNPGYIDGVHLDPNLASNSSGTVSQVEFSSDGTIATLGTSGTNGRLLKYNLTTAWDLSSWSSAGQLNLSSSVMSYPRAFTFGDSGNKVYAVNWANSITNGNIYQWDLTTAYDVTTGSYSNKKLAAWARGNYAIGAAMSPDGDRFYFITTSNDQIHQYNLTTDYDISTASYSNKSLTIPSSVDSAPYGVTFKSDGLKMYVTGLANDRLYEYTLTTAWELDTATYDGVSYYWGGDASSFNQVFFKPDGTKFYFAEHFLGIHQYETINNSNILMNFEDSDIYDRTGTCNIDTIGQASIDTSVKKYGTGSIQMDGAGDYLFVKPVEGDLFNFYGNFTIEFWLYTTTTDTQYMFDSRNASGGATGWSSFLLSNTMYFNVNGTLYTSGTLSNYVNTWIHVAYVRSGSVGKWYIDGTASGSNHNLGTSTIVTGSDGMVKVGAPASASTSTTVNILNGYIDDFRITNGIARYTSNFTPSSEALPKF
jgi:hypothetical protein